MSPPIRGSDEPTRGRGQPPELLWRLGWVRQPRRARSGDGAVSWWQGREPRWQPRRQERQPRRRGRRLRQGWCPSELATVLKRVREESGVRCCPWGVEGRWDGGGWWGWRLYAVELGFWGWQWLAGHANFSARASGLGWVRQKRKWATATNHLTLALIFSYRSFDVNI
jgi:hypothetical protein